jgi:hypothetical protein
MPKKLPRLVELRAKATAKFEAIAKASYQRKKTITEVIPADVTRAKTGRWLDLISPITEWAGLKGDALRYRRQQLRIQQEAALDALALSVRRKLVGRPVLHPLPSKIFVPLLEAASLENPRSKLIDWWADLVVSGTTAEVPRPYLVELMKKIGNEEAAFLENQWKKYSASTLVTGSTVERRALLLLYVRDSSIFLQARIPMKGRKAKVTKQASSDRKKGRLQYGDVRQYAKVWMNMSDEQGIGLSISVWDLNHELSFLSRLFKTGPSVEVCRALNIVEYYDEVLDISSSEWKATCNIRTLSFSELGVEFMKACRPATDGR